MSQKMIMRAGAYSEGVCVSTRTLDDDEAVLAESRALHREGQRGPRRCLQKTSVVRTGSMRAARDGLVRRPTCSKVWLCCSSSDMVIKIYLI